MHTQVINCAQRSPEWYAARAGRLTGSRAGDALSMLKNGKGESAARRDYRLQLAIERVTGLPLEDDFVSKEMRRGIELEPAAIAAYESHTGSIVQRTGFIRAMDLPVGVSLDGHVMRSRVNIEVKCPKSATHIAYRKAKVLPDDYREQVRHGIWVTGAEATDFVSYDDRLPLGLQIFVVRVYAKDLDIPGYEKQALAFLSEVDRETDELIQLRDAA